MKHKFDDTAEKIPFKLDYELDDDDKLLDNDKLISEEPKLNMVKFSKSTPIEKPSGANKRKKFKQLGSLGTLDLNHPASKILKDFGLNMTREKSMYKRTEVGN